MSKREARNIIIVTVLVAVIALSGSFIYSSFDFKGTGRSSKAVNNWKIDAVDVSVCTLTDQVNNSKCGATSGSAENIVGETYIDSVDSLRINFGAKMYNYGDSITYKVTVRNSGQLKAKLTGIKFDKDLNNPVIFTYNNIELGDILGPDTTRTFYVMISYIGEDVISSNEIINALNLSFAVTE